MKHRIRAAAVAAVPTLTVALGMVPANAGTRTAEPLTLPVPSGPHPVGTVAPHLVDRARTDPWAASRPWDCACA